MGGGEYRGAPLPVEFGWPAGWFGIAGACDYAAFALGSARGGGGGGCKTVVLRAFTYSLLFPLPK